MTSSKKNESKGLVPRTGTRVPERRMQSWPRPRPPRRTCTPASLSPWLTTPRLLPSARRRSTSLSAPRLVRARLRWTRRSLTSVRTSSTLLLRRTLPSPIRRWLASSAALLRRWALLSVSSSRKVASPASRVRRRAIPLLLRLPRTATSSRTTLSKTSFTRGAAGLVRPRFLQ